MIFACDQERIFYRSPPDARGTSLTGSPLRPLEDSQEALLRARGYLCREVTLVSAQADIPDSAVEAIEYTEDERPSIYRIRLVSGAYLWVGAGNGVGVVYAVTEDT